ncbi:hypothetical protein E1265_09270 [Streptomyces sp. 8K308]|nr:hypothetical protein E1265_09270 [Streptomyces sp. 8K308]
MPRSRRSSRPPPARVRSVPWTRPAGRCWRPHVLPRPRCGWTGSRHRRRARSPPAGRRRRPATRPPGARP